MGVGKEKKKRRREMGGGEGTGREKDSWILVKLGPWRSALEGDCGLSWPSLFPYF